ncbi:MAG: phosphoribosylformylglycinamidine synthase subunit PurL [Planctomycetota bacterium]|jgi:phosphoribosylformylglycinamidine synthase|nr:phosphoribosylformylglycinamidine synthase subunit PurL [Planctomycetota bacterium]
MNRPRPPARADGGMFFSSGIKATMPTKQLQKQLLDETVNGGTYLVEVAVRDPGADLDGRKALRELREYGLAEVERVRSVKMYAVNGPFTPRDMDRIAGAFLTDPVVEMYSINQPVLPNRDQLDQVVEIARRPGVMEPVEASALKGIAELGYRANWVRTGRRYLVSGSIVKRDLLAAVNRILANPVIEQVSIGDPLALEPGLSEISYHDRREVRIDGLSDAELETLSTTGQLYLSLGEMRAVQKYFSGMGRNPTDVELETIAQTWSEHCSHKTFRGVVRYRENGGEPERIDNLLKTTIVRATRELDREWCWSVFEDNSGVIDFDGDYGIAVKVETHNHPSAIEPYGGAGTGIGGVIRDPLGTGLGGKPILNTDVFCFGPPDLPKDEVPPGALHPLRVFKGVVAGVGDYGNRMGIPTANGAICFDRRFTGNPLVFCGNIALIPREMAARRRPLPGDVALVVGGRTGRDGIHGATFSSVELDENSEMASSGAVQIGNPIEEKKVADFILRARDAGLYSCITDCGAGGLSSALGEMGAECGVRVNLEKVPLKYEGLTCNEIWISEAQERMVIAAARSNLISLLALAKEESVEVAEIAVFTDDRRLKLLWHGQEVGDLDMAFLHDGVPRTEREAWWRTPDRGEPEPPADEDCGGALKAILAAWNVCSKEWVVRQYDHEVQGGSVVKPFVGAASDGPGDACVITPRLGSTRAVAVANGINPLYSDIDPYWMAANAIDEALRNLVAVGAPLSRCALLDNFCWGNCNKPERLGELVRAARACRDFAIAYGVPFISGKDSLNNEFAVDGEAAAIPGTLLISAVAVMADCGKAVTMDLKEVGNFVYLAGVTRDELGGSHYYALRNAIGGNVPRVDAGLGKRIFAAVSAAAERGLLRSAHDCSEGGLAVAAAEMAFAGGLGLDLDLEHMITAGGLRPEGRLFSESASRLLLEVEPGKSAELEKAFAAAGAPLARIGLVNSGDRFIVRLDGEALLDERLDDLKAAWRDALPTLL